MEENKIQILKTPDGVVQLAVTLDRDTVWLNQRQMATLFDKDVRTVNEHIRNVYDEQEVSGDSTIRKFRIVQQVAA